MDKKANKTAGLSPAWDSKDRKPKKIDDFTKAKVNLKEELDGFKGKA